MDRNNDFGSDSGVCSQISFDRNNSMKRLESFPANNLRQEYDSLSENSITTNQSAHEDSPFDDNHSGECNELRHDCRQNIMELISWLESQPTQDVILDRDVRSTLNALSEATQRYTNTGEAGEGLNVMSSIRPDSKVGKKEIGLSSVNEKIQKFEKNAPRLRYATTLHKNMVSMEKKEVLTKTTSVGIQCNTDIPVDGVNNNIFNLDEIDSIRCEDFYISNIDDENNVNLEKLLQEIILPTVKKQIEKQLKTGNDCECKQLLQNMEGHGSNLDSFRSQYNQDAIAANMITIHKSRIHASCQTTLDIRDAGCQTMQNVYTITEGNSNRRNNTVGTQSSFYAPVLMNSFKKTSQNTEAALSDKQTAMTQTKHCKGGKDSIDVPAKSDMTIKIMLVPQKASKSVEETNEKKIILHDDIKNTDIRISNTLIEKTSSLKLKNSKIKKNTDCKNASYSEMKDIIYKQSVLKVDDSYRSISDEAVIQDQSKFSLRSEATKKEYQIDHYSHHLKTNHRNTFSDSMYNMRPRYEIETIERARTHFRRVFEPLQRSLSDLQNRVKAICMDPVINSITTDLMPSIIDTEPNSSLGVNESIIENYLKQQMNVRRKPTTTALRSPKPNKLRTPEILEFKNEIMQKRKPVHYHSSARPHQHVCKQSNLGKILESQNPDYYINEPCYLRHRPCTCGSETLDDNRHSVYNYNILKDTKRNCNLVPMYHLQNTPSVFCGARKHYQVACESKPSSNSLKSSAITALDMKEFYRKSDNHRTNCCNMKHNNPTILPYAQQRQSKRRVHKSSEARRKEFFVGTVNYYVEHKSPYCNPVHNKELVGKKTCPWKSAQKGEPVLSDPDYRWSTPSMNLRTRNDTEAISYESYVSSMQPEHNKRKSHQNPKYVP